MSFILTLKALNMPTSEGPWNGELEQVTHSKNLKNQFK
jgi:hypothetical protein